VTRSAGQAHAPRDVIRWSGWTPLGSFFRPSNLIALREIALRQVAQVVDRSLEPYIQTEIDPNRELQVRSASQSASAPIQRRSIWVARAARMAQAEMVNCSSSMSIFGRDDDPERQLPCRPLSVRGEPGAPGRPAEGQRRSPRRWRNCPRKAHHPGDLRHSATSGWPADTCSSPRCIASCAMRPPWTSTS